MNLREADLKKFGEQIYHHFRKQGNHRWDTSVHKKEDGSYCIVFRHSFSKKNAEGVKKHRYAMKALFLLKMKATWSMCLYQNSPTQKYSKIRISLKRLKVEKVSWASPCGPFCRAAHRAGSRLAPLTRAAATDAQYQK